MSPQRNQVAEKRPRSAVRLPSPLQRTNRWLEPDLAAEIRLDNRLVARLGEVRWIRGGFRRQRRALDGSPPRSVMVSHI